MRVAHIIWSVISDAARRISSIQDINSVHCCQHVVFSNKCYITNTQHLLFSDTIVWDNVLRPCTHSHTDRNRNNSATGTRLDVVSDSLFTHHNHVHYS